MYIGKACETCAEGMQTLLEKVQAAVDRIQTKNTTTSCTSNIAFQYQPTSCTEVKAFNPNSPSGYYWLKTGEDIPTQIHCLFEEPSQNNPAESCKQIRDQFPTSISSYYWLRSPDGKAVQVYCNMD